jgi:hypothetical protein
MSEASVKLLAGFLRTGGDAHAAARSLWYVVRNADAVDVDEVNLAIVGADAGHIEDIECVFRYPFDSDDPRPAPDTAIHPTPAALRLFAAMLPRPSLAISVFGPSMDSFPDAYVAALREAALRSQSNSSLAEMLGPALLEHWPRFVEEHASEWLASSEPRLWRIIASMYLTAEAECGIANAVRVGPRVALAQAMARHQDREVRAVGERELEALWKWNREPDQEA